jgi:hypothetical protein
MPKAVLEAFGRLRPDQTRIRQVLLVTRFVDVGMALGMASTKQSDASHCLVKAVLKAMPKAVK